MDMTLVAQQVALEMIAAVRPLVAQIRRKNRQLADQVERAATSTALNVAEGARSQGGNEAARYHVAAGSASETRVGLAIAEAWGYFGAAQRAAAEAHLDHLAALLWGLTHRE
jgi:four helix bundle protein